MSVKDKYKRKQQAVQEEVYSQWTKIFMIPPVWQKYSNSHTSECHGAFAGILHNNLKIKGRQRLIKDEAPKGK